MKIIILWRFFMAKKQNEKLRKEWEQRIARYKTSGMTQSKWCEANDLSYHQFKYWLKRVNTSSIKVEESNSKWIPISIDDDLHHGNNNSLQIKVGQVTVEVKPDFNPLFLVNVVKALQTLC